MIGIEIDSPGFNVFLVSPTYCLAQSGVGRDGRAITQGLVSSPSRTTVPGPALTILAFSSSTWGFAFTHASLWSAVTVRSGSSPPATGEHRAQQTRARPMSIEFSHKELYPGDADDVDIGALLAGTGRVPRSIRIRFCDPRLFIAFLAQALTDSFMRTPAGPVTVG